MPLRPFDGRLSSRFRPNYERPIPINPCGIPHQGLSAACNYNSSIMGIDQLAPPCSIMIGRTLCEGSRLIDVGDDRR